MSDIATLSALDRIAQPMGKPAEPKLWQTAQQFEEIFMAQFVKAMRATEGRGDLLEESAGRETFDEMFSEAIARNMVEHGSTGLARAIYRDLGGAFRAVERKDAESLGAPSASVGVRSERPEERHGP